MYTLTIDNIHLSAETTTMFEAMMGTEQQVRKFPHILLEAEMFHIFMEVAKNPEHCDQDKYEKVINRINEDVDEGFKASLMAFEPNILSATKFRFMIAILPDIDENAEGAPFMLGNYTKCVTVKLITKTEQVDEGVQMAQQELQALAIDKSKSKSQ